MNIETSNREDFAVTKKILSPKRQKELTSEYLIYWALNNGYSFVEETNQFTLPDGKTFTVKDSRRLSPDLNEKLLADFHSKVQNMDKEKYRIYSVIDQSASNEEIVRIGRDSIRAAIEKALNPE